ncbi:MAG: class I tRNA ligase family protein, partial [Planctomycetota bacterium]
NSRAYKMSKSRGNVVNPDFVVEQYGADALRMYEMFMGPLEATKPWSMSGVEGVSRFLGRVWRLMIEERVEDVTLSEAVSEEPPTEEQLRILHKTIKAVTEDIAKMSFNTAISRMMEFTNAMGQQTVRSKAVLSDFVLLLSPFAPHVAEELWSVLGHADSLAYQPWPEFDEALLQESVVEIPVQVNGKVRSKVSVAADADQATMQQAAEHDETIAKYLEGKTIVKAVVIPGRMINFVVK